jgi:hypothetical protein
MTESRTDQTGAPTDLAGGMPATDETRPLTGTAVARDADPLTALDPDALQRLAEIADRLVPQAHGMPSAAEVVNDERLQFVLQSRPDLVEPLVAALRAEHGDDVTTRLDRLASTEPTALAALQLVVVAAYYTDRQVRNLIGYPGQEAIEVRSWELPPYLEEGLIDAVLARGPVWRDPATGRRAVSIGCATTYADRWSSAARQAEGETDGRQGA